MTSRRRQKRFGLLLYRVDRNGELEVFLVHSGHPKARDIDDGAWTIPKGGSLPAEDPKETALREFWEEAHVRPTEPIEFLGTARQSDKIVTAWVWQGDADPDKAYSSLKETQIPYDSGHWVTYPEVDRYAWFGLTTARTKILTPQIALLDTLIEFHAKRQEQNKAHVSGAAREPK